MQNSESLGPKEGAVDGPDEIVTTQEPGYAMSERIVRDHKDTRTTREQTRGADNNERTTRPISRDFEAPNRAAADELGPAGPH